MFCMEGNEENVEFVSDPRALESILNNPSSSPPKQPRSTSSKKEYYSGNNGKLFVREFKTPGSVKSGFAGESGRKRVLGSGGGNGKHFVPQRLNPQMVLSEMKPSRNTVRQLGFLPERLARSAEAKSANKMNPIHHPNSKARKGLNFQKEDNSKLKKSSTDNEPQFIVPPPPPPAPLNQNAPPKIIIDS